MKQSKICLFAFRPEEYREMERYVQEMADDGWKLHWCRGVLAEFTRTEEKLRCAVDPHAVTSPIYLRRYPKRRLRERAQEGWYSVARTKGCQIFYTDDPDLPSPVTGDLRPLVKNTCRLVSMVWVLALLAAGGYLFNQKALICSLVLNNLYLVLALLAAFLLVFHAVNAILLTAVKAPPKTPRLCRRYLTHDAALLFLLVLAVALELGGRNDMLFYFALPILMVAAGIALLRMLSGGGDARRLLPVVAILSVLMFALIILTNRWMSKSNSEWSTRQQEALLAQAAELPVLRLSDVKESGEVQNAAKSSRSILGANLLYAEQSGEDYIFTNYTVMKADWLARPIFEYLFEQAGADFNETFTEHTEQGLTFYMQEQAGTCLFQNGGTVYFFTVPAGSDLHECAALLLERQGA